MTKADHSLKECKLLCSFHDCFKLLRLLYVEKWWCKFVDVSNNSFLIILLNVCSEYWGILLTDHLGLQQQAIIGSVCFAESLTVNVLCKGVFPAVHLDELYAAQDLVHEPHAPVSDRHALLAEIRRQPRCQHLSRRQEEEMVTKWVAWEEMKADVITLALLHVCWE